MNEKRDDYSVEKRFGHIVGGENWGVVPYPLYKYQSMLGLNNSEIWFLTWVIIHKWTENLPFPSLSALARYSGMSRQGIQAIVRKLKNKGLIKVYKRYYENGGQATNEYDIEPLIKILEECIKDDPHSKYKPKSDYRSSL